LSAARADDPAETSRPASTAAVPSELVGTWKGTIQRDPDFGSGTFSALLALVDANVGELCGTVAHPSLRCGGQVRLQNASANAVVVSADYTFGSCRDGSYFLTPDAEGTIRLEWHDPASPRVDAGVLTRAGGYWTALPPEYAGVWQGDVQIDPAFGGGTSPTTVVLVSGNLGTVMGTIAHPASSSGGELVLETVATEAISGSAGECYGSDLDGTYWFRPINDHLMLYEWYDLDSSRFDSGVLERISGSHAGVCALAGFGDANGDPLSQNDSDWAYLPYGGTDYTYRGQSRFLPFVYYGDGADTIGAWGCALTSAAMSINYYAQRQGSAFRTDPAQLNHWLQHNDGYATGEPLPSAQDPQYVDSSFVIPAKVIQYANENGVQMALVGQDRIGDETLGHFVERTRATLDASVCALDPALLGVGGPGHFVAATGKDEIEGAETWRIHDPLLTGPSTLVAEYGNSYAQIMRFSDGQWDRSLTLYLHSPADMVITDPQGRRVGFDPQQGTRHLEIPGSSYGMEQLAAADGQGGLVEQTVLYIPGAILGPYTLQVIGTGRGTYTLHAVGIDSDGQAHLFKIVGTASPGSVDSFAILYASRVGQPLTVTGETICSAFLPVVLRSP
jgi:hypothetical protein